MNIEDIPADTMDTSGATTDAELQVFHPQNTQNCATQRAPAPNNQNGDDGDTRPLLIIDSEGDGEWVRVQRQKRARTNTGSADTQPPTSINAFENLSVSDKLSALFSEVSGIDKKVDKCVAIHSKVEALETKVNDQSARISQLEYRSLDLEARSRRNNIIFGGIPEESGENCADVIAEFLKEHLNIDPCPTIPRIHRLGRFQRNKTRPIIANFIDTRDADNVVSNAKLLKGKKFSINRDFPKEISNARKALWPEFKETRSRYPNSRVSLAYPAKIVKDGTVIVDKFPHWNLMLHGDRQSIDVERSIALHSQPQGARAFNGPYANGGSVPQQALLNPAPRSSSTHNRRQSRPPRRTHPTRDHAPSRERSVSRRPAARGMPSSPALIRPWDDPTLDEDLVSQSILDRN